MKKKECHKCKYQWDLKNADQKCFVCDDKNNMFKKR